METANDIKSESPIDILFVDDEKNVLQSLKRLCIDDYHSVLLANSGEEALEILNNNPNIGLIVSDQRMPAMTGSEFLEKAKEMLPDAVRILLTGYSDINAVADAINRGGAYRYITKPWNDEELLQIIGDSVGDIHLLRKTRDYRKLSENRMRSLKDGIPSLNILYRNRPSRSRTRIRNSKNSMRI